MITKITTANAAPATSAPAAEGGKDNTGLIILGLALAAAAGYYFLVYKPNKKAEEEAAKKTVEAKK